MIGGQERFGQYLADTRVVTGQTAELFATYDFRHDVFGVCGASAPVDDYFSASCLIASSMSPPRDSARRCTSIFSLSSVV